MKDRPERQQLEEALKDEPAGSAKIQALRDYAILKDIAWRTEQRPAVVNDLDARQLIVEKVVVEQRIQLRQFQRDAYEYSEAFTNAEGILQPYLAIATPSVNPYQVFQEDLREINWQKGRKLVRGDETY